jgi:hypothetical protein
VRIVVPVLAAGGNVAVALLANTIATGPARKAVITDRITA